MWELQDLLEKIMGITTAAEVSGMVLRKSNALEERVQAFLTAARSARPNDYKWDATEYFSDLGPDEKAMVIEIFKKKGFVIGKFSESPERFFISTT